MHFLYWPNTNAIAIFFYWPNTNTNAIFSIGQMQMQFLYWPNTNANAIFFYWSNANANAICFLLAKCKCNLFSSLRGMPAGQSIIQDRRAPINALFFSCDKKTQMHHKCIRQWQNLLPMVNDQWSLTI